MTAVQISKYSFVIIVLFALALNMISEQCISLGPADEKNFFLLNLKI